MSVKKIFHHVEGGSACSRRWCLLWFAAASSTVGMMPTTVASGADPHAIQMATVSYVSGQFRGFSDRRKAEDLIRKARELVNQGHEQLNNGRLDLADEKLKLAEWYAARAEKLNVDYNSFLGRMADTPARIREDIAKVRRNQPRAQAGDRRTSVTAQTPLPPPVNYPPIPTNQSPANFAQPSGQFAPQSFAQRSAYAASAFVGDPRQTGPVASVEQQAESLAASPRNQAIEALSRGRQALIQGNQVAAVSWYRNAIAIGAEFSPDEYGPAHLADELVAAGVDETLLVPPLSQGPAAVASAELLDPDMFARQELQIPTVLGDATEFARPMVAQTSPLAAQAGPDPAQLATRDLANVADANAEAEGANQRAESLRFLSAAQAALDRGDLQEAQELAVAAEQMGVPDSAYQPGEPHPWMLLLDINKKRSRQMAVNDTNHPAGLPPINTGPRIAVAAFEDTLPAPTRSDGSLLDPFLVDPSVPDETLLIDPEELFGAHSTEQALSDPPPGLDFDDDQQTSPSTVPAIPQELEHPAAQPMIPPYATQLGVQPSPGPPPETAMDLFQRGEAALTDHNIGEARELFHEAWQQAGQLDPNTRQRLSDHLQIIGGSEVLDTQQSQPLSTAGSAIGAEEQAVLRRLMVEIGREQAAANKIRDDNPTLAWQQLKDLRVKVAQADINTESRQQLFTRLDRGIADIDSYIEQNRPMIELDQRNRAILEEIDREREQTRRNQQTLANFLEEFNKFMDEQRYPDAKIIAKKAKELDPDNPVVLNMMWKAQTAQQIASRMSREADFRSRMLDTLGDVERSGNHVVDDYEFPAAAEWSDLTSRRKRLANDPTRRYTKVEMEIYQALKRMVDVRLMEQPLAVVIEDLGKMAGVNVFLDPEGLATEGISSDNLVSIQLRKPISLRSALNLILEPLHLSYVIQNEVLLITTEQDRQGDVYQFVYPVADLVIPIPNFLPDGDIGLPGAIKDAYRTAGYGYVGGAVQSAPFTMASDDATEKGGNQSVLAQMGATNMIPGMPGAGGVPFGFGAGGTPQGGGSQADFETLIDLITSTIEPDSWEDVGTGTGSVRGFDTNLSLVVSNTQEVHEKIADLLAQLRRLQDLQVTIEVRFITLADDFFERIGVDFDFDVDDNTGSNFTQVQLLDDDGPSITVGLDPGTNLPTADLDIQFNQGSFGATTPAFGGFDANAAANVGFAILSDIEAFFVIEALHGDDRTNVLQAPKVTLFNGQNATVSDNSQRPFVTSVIPVVGDFAAAHQPVITVLSEGTTLSVQAVVSNDRRFVRLTLVPFFSRIGDVDTFTFDGTTTSDTGTTTTVDPNNDSTTGQNNAFTTTTGTTVQLPTFAFTTVNTTVSVPDGGTILLGGIKRLAEGRNERGVPILSKVPYINRLFRNVGIGRETESLMMMVTPRIIIQEEEEEKLGLSLP